MNLMHERYQKEIAPALFKTFAAMLRANKIRLPKRNTFVGGPR